jgi:hypothetical protein
MTPEPDDDPNVDPAAVDTDPPADDEARNAETEEHRGKLIKSLQDKVAEGKQAKARADALEAENERLRRALSPAAPGSSVDPRQHRIRETVAWAEGQKNKDGSKDPVAGVVVDLLTDNEILRQRLEEKEALDEIEDKATKRKVREHIASELRQGRQLDVKAAKAEVEAADLEETRAENLRLQEALKTAQAPAGVTPPTHQRSVPATELKSRTFESLEDFDAAKSSLSTFERLKLEEQIDKGTVKVKR